MAKRETTIALSEAMMAQQKNNLPGTYLPEYCLDMSAPLRIDADGPRGILGRDGLWKNYSASSCMAICKTPPDHLGGRCPLSGHMDVDCLLSSLVQAAHQGAVRP